MNADTGLVCSIEKSMKPGTHALSFAIGPTARPDAGALLIYV
jgi:hypothetical protein